VGNVTRIGALVGLPLEAAILRRRLAGAALEIEIRCANADPVRAAAAAATLAGGDAELLVSFGLAGALDPALRPGDLLLADRVLGPDGRRYPAGGAARSRLAAALAGVAGVRAGSLLGVERVIATPAEKARLFAETGAAAIDMESLPLVAAAAGKPVLVLRAIADPAARAIPGAALGALDGAGRIRIGLLLAALARRPGDLVGLVRLACDSARARASLGRAALALGRAVL
jgi:adenosylhomocysteine nucleosidase